MDTALCLPADPDASAHPDDPTVLHETITVQPPDPLVDADALLALTSELRSLRTRLNEADLTDEQRQRWQHTMGAIAEGAPTDVDKARAQLRRLSARVERVAGRA